MARHAQKQWVENDGFWSTLGLACLDIQPARRLILPILEHPFGYPVLGGIYRVGEHSAKLLDLAIHSGLAVSSLAYSLFASPHGPSLGSSWTVYGWQCEPD